MTGRDKLTDRQQEVLDFIQAKIQRDGYPPTIREIGDQLGIRSTNGVNDHLKALAKKGYLQRTEAKSRACVPTSAKGEGHLREVRDPAREALRSDVVPVDIETEMIDIPILGKIAAGQPILALEQQEDTVRIDRFFLGKNKDVFGLRVVGESMIEDGIHDGDFIFVRKQRQAPRGSIVVALIDDEATVKRYYPEGDRIRFQPSNSTMQPIYVAASEFRDTQILGVVVGIYRRMD
ncbi:MAG: transcriptional repressor LexA [Deltaproteobacteria bacterium]|jgi:repressor LexA|nr:transcriptional repressor LexA [Deltaproteobacteria bacterium]